MTDALLPPYSVGQQKAHIINVSSSPVIPSFVCLTS
jgi:hypothetical protein